MSRHNNSKTERSPIDMGDLPSLVGFHLRLAQVRVFQDFTRTLEAHELNPTLFGALMVIQANHGLKQTELAQAVQLDRSTMVTIIDKLEKRGLVKRAPIEGDRRANAIALTDVGETLLQEVTPLVRAHEQRLTDQLSAAETKQLVDLLGRIFPAS